MDHAWTQEQLRSFASVARDTYDNTISYELRDEAEGRAFELEPVAQQIMNAYEPGLGDYERGGDSSFSRWSGPAKAALRAAGLAAHWEELREKLRPEAPTIAADRLHPWVWESAAPLWAASAHRDAVSSAARTINARAQQKSGRHDISEADLMMQVFDTKPPEPGRARLWIPGDRTSPSWRSVQEGLRFFAAGCFRAIRNPAAHDEIIDWSENEALEYLCAFSALARWLVRSELHAEAGATDVTA